MSGTIIPLFPRRVFDYSNVATSQVVETILIKAINVSEYTAGTLIVRVHTGTSVTSTALLKVLVKTTSPSIEDPSADFTDSAAVGTATINSTVSGTAPAIVVAQLTAGFGGMVQISIQATQASGATVKGVFSAELVMKA